MNCLALSKACCAALVLVAVFGARIDRARADTCGELPVLLVVQDRSGSMEDPPDPNAGGDSKWDIAASTVPGVLNQYNNQFQFGLMLFPGSSDACDQGFVEQAVPSSPNDISSSYANTGPTGATPTAQTLGAARQYLDSLQLSVPAYILLITDGLPNCNSNENGSSCSCTVSPQSSCDPYQGGTNLDCLDDTNTESAAASAYAGGYQVFVVGFGDASTAGNNKHVLDAIASSGGTGQAYSANDQASLENQLNSIVGSVGSCCMDICAQGDTECDSAGNVEFCVGLPSGCLGWGSATGCSSGSTCSSGACQSCSDTCSLGATQCGIFGDVETCTADSNGCTNWSSGFCPNGSTCQGNACQSCASTCTPGATQCNGDTLLTCTSDYEGCTSWTSSTCGYGSQCSVSGNSGACVSCSNACTQGAQTCADDGTAQVCVATELGCTSWQQQACGSGETCSGGSCNVCNACNPGDWRCAGGPQTCVDLGNGCSGWQDAQPCGASQVCSQGACMDCSGACNVGDVQCSGSDIQVCTPQAGACNAFVTTQTCGNGEICSAGACCASACTPGATQCGPSGEVETCVGAAGTCPSWQASACASGSACIAGSCDVPCALQSELASCASGFTCQASAQGSYCVAVGSTGTGATSTSGGAGSTSGSTGGSGTGSASNATGASTGTGAGTSGVPQVDKSVTAKGCSSSGGESGFGLLALGAVLLLRRRR